MKIFIFHLRDTSYKNEDRPRHPDTTFFFELTTLVDPTTFHDDSPESDELLAFADTLDVEFGEHSWSTTCHAGRNYYEAVGFNSYDIPPSRWSELILKWYDYFKEKGFAPGAIQSMTTRDYYAMYYPWTKYPEDEAA